MGVTFLMLCGVGCSGELRAAKCSDGRFQSVSESEPFCQPEPLAESQRIA